jgi:hypothetical protein
MVDDKVDDRQAGQKATLNFESCTSSYVCECLLLGWLLVACPGALADVVGGWRSQVCALCTQSCSLLTGTQKSKLDLDLESLKFKI